MQPGTHLGHYEIVEAIGKGGMGEGGKARDTKLGREVAIKTLPPEFAEDPDRLARFEREAKLLASVNHPNIAAIYGLEEHEGSRFLVLELVEGDTLAERLQRGAIPVEESLELALQIAEALEAAHEKGVVHRDLKPANIKVTPDDKVKVLDFGLAKAFAEDQPDANLSNSPTLSMQATQAGIILGTAAYMSPEQAKGLPADSRADVFSFGCVLYEMLTGRMAFRGDLATEILASVINQEPDYPALHENLHPRIGELLRRCFKKDPKDRWQAIGDVRIEIDELLNDPRGLIWQPGGEVVNSTFRSRLGWVAAGVLALIAGLAGWSVRSNEPVAVPPPSDPIRFEMNVQSQMASALYLAISPDGNQLAFTSSEPDGVTRIWVRTMDTPEARPLPDTENGRSLFWSPDSRWIGFSNGPQLKKIRSTGLEPPVTLADVPGGAATGTWNEDDVIVFSDPGSGGGLHRVSADGGTSTVIIERPDNVGFRFPVFLPDQNRFLYSRAEGGNADVFLGALDQTPGDSVNEPLLAGIGDVKYVPSGRRSDGYMLYLAGETLMARRFDPDSLATVGDPVPIAERVGIGGANPYFTASAGVLAYRQGSRSVESQLAIYDRTGTADPIGESGAYRQVSVSPDGTRAATSLDIGGFVVLVHDLTRELSMRVPSQGGEFPVWTSDDNSELVFSGGSGIYRAVVDRGGDPELLYAGTDSLVPGQNRSVIVQSVSPDGRFLLLAHNQPSTGIDLALLPLETDSSEGARQLTPLVTAPGTQWQADLSPDGRWVAYSSNETGTYEVYVQAVGLGGTVSEASVGRVRISNGGGYQPRWNSDGTELLYLIPDGTLASASVDGSGASFEAEGTTLLFDVPIFPAPNDETATANWDVFPDDQRFLFNTAIEEDMTGAEVSPPINVILNWQALLED